MESVYTVLDYSLDWTLPTRQPTILLAQLASRFDRRDGDGRILQAVDLAYEARLLAAVGALADHRAQFLIFPEYACPLRLWPDMLTAIREMPHGSVCILPFEHLHIDEFSQLVTTLPAIPANRPLLDSVVEHVVSSVAPADRESAIVNVAMCVVKARDGIHFIPQPKLRPAQFEEAKYLGRRLLCGGFQRLIVAGQNCRFAIAICFDFVSRDEAHEASPRDALGKSHLDFLFVPECNPSPLHESYARAILDLYQHAVWSGQHTVVVMCNCAARSHVPGLQIGAFGYSRIFGQLGEVTPSQEHVFALARHETLVLSTPRSLAHVVEKADRIGIRPQSAIIFRPHESLIRVRTPTVGSGPSRDPTVERTNTEVLVLRPDQPTSWYAMRPLCAWPAPPLNGELPSDFVVQDGLVGAAPFIETFADLLRGPSPVWIVGDGGVGKTALAASALNERVVKPNTARVIWIDMAAVGPTPEDLVETLLLAIGRTAALHEDVGVQWKTLNRFFDEHPSVLVLDSLERWKGPPLPSQVFQFHRWPTRLVLTSRREPDEREDDSVIRLEPLAPLHAAELLRRSTDGPLSSEDAAALYECVQGSPLACVWVGGLLKAGASNPLVVGLLAALHGHRINGLEELFEWCLSGLSERALHILAVLCELPAPVSIEDVGRVLDLSPDAVVASLEILQGRNLVMHRGSGHAEVQTRHPFVRLFWERSRQEVAGQIVRRIIRITESDIERHGGDRNWEGHRILLSQWSNVRHVLELLRQTTSTADRMRFLKLWRAVDYMLWSKGLWRERLRLGTAAVETARVVGQPGLEAYALFDAIAETEWHRRSPREAVESKINEAARIYGELGSTVDLARVEYYRGRMLRHYGLTSEAVTAATHAVDLARGTDSLVLGAALNGLGNALRDASRYEEAVAVYSEGLRFLDEARDREMVGVAHRNLGRTALELGRVHETVRELEKALDVFSVLELGIEEAETAIHHARAIAVLGEIEEAEFELERAAERLATLGSKIRDSDLADARHWIDSRRERLAR